MIRNILEKAPFLRKENSPRLILQPMQHIPELRRYLGENGFLIEQEKQALAEGKFYQIFLAVYDGEVREYTKTELLIGRYNIEHKYENKENFLRLCERQLDVLREKISGLEKGGRSAEKERKLYAAIENECKDL